MKLSERMKAVAAMVTNGNVVADVGTDHGYIPIRLVQKGYIQRAIAMDINEGPLQRAQDNIKNHKLEKQIETRLSDGVAKLEVGEADTIVIAGMGGELIMRILTEGREVCRGAKELILQPQSDIQKVRQFLREQSYRIIDENMIYEDGKYYFVMKVIPVETDLTWEKLQETATIACDRYGPLLLKNGNPILRKYLVKEHQKLEQIEGELEKQASSEAILLRLQEIRKEIAYNESAYTIMGAIKDAGIGD